VTSRLDIDRVVEMTRARLSNTHLGILAAALTAAFVLLPGPLASVPSGQSYGDEQHLRVKVSAAFVGYWHTGQRSLTPELSHLVDYWRWYHAVKAVTALGLLIVLIVLAARLWKTYARTGPDARAWSSATGGVVVTVLSVFAFVVALANIQGTLAPFSSLMSMLPINSARGDLATMAGQVTHELAHYPSGSSGALKMMVGDLAFYHVVVAVTSWFVAVVLIMLMIASWRTYARAAKADRRARRLFSSLGIASVLMIAAFVVLALANTTTAIHSPTAVLNFYNGTF
jgi:hypothetical protein